MTQSTSLVESGVFSGKKKLSLFDEENKQQARECLLFFFKNRPFWAGGTVNPVHLLNEKAIRVVIDTPILDGVEVAYRSLSQSPPEHWDTAQKFWDIKLVKRILDECSIVGIPKWFASGVLLIYLEQCQGVETLKRLEKFNHYRQKLLESMEKND